MQPPPSGTIARGELPLHYNATKEEALRAGEDLENPFPLFAMENGLGGGNVQEHADARQVSVGRGAKLFQIYCVSCHGPNGAGDGPVAKRGFPPPPPLATGKSVQIQDGQLFHIVSFGQGSMPAMANQLSRANRWDAVIYVRSLQEAARPQELLPQTAEAPQ
jgi:mono/diheme cytochrome c family protein